MRFFVGTIGFSYPEWKGNFYPDKLPQKQMLRYSSQRFATVELNNTFRQLPTASQLKNLAQQVPASFRFAIKAPQSITHFKRLKNVGNETRRLLRAASTLKAQQGPVLFQLPPNFKKDLNRLEGFLTLLGDRTRAAIEFRHES